MTSLTKDNKQEQLKHGISNVTLSGRVHMNPERFSIDMISEATGYKYSRASFGVECGDGNIVYVEVMGGFYPDKPQLKLFGKEGEMFEVDFKDRLDDSVIDNVASYSLKRGALERDANNKNITTKMVHDYDMVQYLKDHLVDGMHVVVKGGFDVSEYQGESQRKVTMSSIFLAYPKKPEYEKDAEGKDIIPEPTLDVEGNEIKPEPQYNEFAEFKQTMLITNSEKVKISKDELEKGKINVPVFMAGYAKEVNGKLWKKQYPFAQQLTLTFDSEEEAQKKLKIANMLFVVPQGKVRELVVLGRIVEGTDSRQVKKEDVELAPDVKQMLEYGLITMEEVMSTVTVNASRVREIQFSMPDMVDDDKGRRKLALDDEKYTLEVLFPKELSDDDDSFDDDEDEANQTVENEATDDESWMSELGL